jgi:hypothetical protein
MTRNYVPGKMQDMKRFVKGFGGNKRMTGAVVLTT